MADSRFPLFRLPFLALCKVIDFYGPHDIIQLSFCSKRSLRVTKLQKKKKGMIMADLWADIGSRVNLYFTGSGFCYRFVVSKVQDLHNQQTQMIRIGDAVTPSIYKKTETVTYWDDKIFGIEQVVRYINDLFDVPITTIDLKSEEYKNEFIDTMDCLMKAQEYIEECILHNEYLTDGCLTHLLDNCKITEGLWIHGEPTRKFKNDWNIRLNYLRISNGSWITLQNLMNIDCLSLNIVNPSLTSKELNQFLKNWQNGGNSRIRYARIEMNSIDQEAITSGIETVSQPETLQRSYPSVRHLTVMKKGGLDIQRNDGTTGTIYLSGNTFGFGVDPIEGSI
ncbi:unnamed protein product [Caenorhabditis brenneri]